MKLCFLLASMLDASDGKRCWVSVQRRSWPVVEGWVRDTGSDHIISLMTKSGRPKKIDLTQVESIARLHE